MSQTLYEEAIAEARRLTEMAEQNAKNKIIDAVTPQIKRLIEQELMGSEVSEPEESEDDGVESDEMESGEGAETIDLDALAMNPETSDVGEMPTMPVSPAPASPMSSKAKSNTSFKVDGDEIEITVGGTKIEIEPAEEGDEMGDDLLLDRPVAEALARMVAQGRGRHLRNKLTSLSERTRTLRRALSEARRVGTTSQKRRLASIFESLAREAVTLRKQAILTEKSTGGRTPETQLVDSIIKEMKHMSRRNGKNVFDFLFEAEDEDKKAPETEMGDEGGDEVELDLGGEDSDESEAGGDEDVDVAAIRSAVEELAGALGMKVEEEDAGGEEGSEDALSLETDMTDGDVYGETDGMSYESDMGMREAAKKKPKTEADKKKEEAKKMKETDAKKKEETKKVEESRRAALRRRIFETMKGTKDETDKMEETDEKVEETNESVYEIDESALRRALVQMRSSRRGRRLGEAAVDAAPSFGGGEAGDEMFIDVDEETLLNALADELGTAPKPKMGGAGLATEAVRLRRQVADYRKVAGQLQSQLVEMNLFNAKLLYANKLMQNRDLSAKQQRAIVEALDNAKTLREAKLLYKSLTESLNKSTNKGGLTEGRTRILGSSSQSARSAQPINEAGGTDRWALLAGIKKD